MTRTTLVLRAVLAAAVVLSVAFANAALLRAKWNLDDLGTSRRYWEDMTVAVSRFETRNWGPAQVVSIDDALGSHVYRRLREIVPRAALRADLQPWEFWRTVEFRSFNRIAPLELRFSDDAGRARLATLAFLGLGGIAPYFPIWLPFLAFAPLSLWLMFESLRAGEGFTGGAFLALLSFSAYFLEVLTLPYSAAGFHLLGALIVVALAFFALGPTPSLRGVVMRAVIAAVSLHLATWCRSSAVIFLFPATVLLLIALLRAEAHSSLARRALFSCVLLLAVSAPKALAPKQSHEVWIGMWEGLGDFDRKHGHVWSDAKARLALEGEGYAIERRGPYWNPETEAIFRRLVLRDIGNDPWWYANILVRRVGATVSQWRLLPTKAETGVTYEWPQDPAEGVTDTYYNFVQTADVLTAMGRTWEAPLWLFWIAPLVCVGTFVRHRREARRRSRIGLLAIFAMSTLAMPVAVTTASGIETQAFVLVYLLCAAYLGSDLAEALLYRFPRFARAGAFLPPEPAA
jgi:hypothetical protein